MTSKHIEFSNENKVILTFNVDSNTARKFIKFCDNKSINRSYLVRKILKDFCSDAETNFDTLTKRNFDV
ncbi:MAG: hypothetical protein ABH828_00510 [archaeon]